MLQSVCIIKSISFTKAFQIETFGGYDISAHVSNFGDLDIIFKLTGCGGITVCV